MVYGRVVRLALKRRERRPFAVPCRRARRESGTVGIALAAILLVTALVIAAWRFGGHETPQVAGVNASPTKQTTRLAPTQQRVTLSIRAVRGPSFTPVRAGSENGKPLYTETLEKGQLQRFTKKALFLSVARPRNVVVRFNGAPLTLPPNGRQLLSGATATSG
jgi:hypothetical protein